LADRGFVLPVFPPVHRADAAADALRRADEYLSRHLPRAAVGR